jgi:hypothetical protein
VEGLRRFLKGEVLPWFDNRKKELANRPLIREQAFGESLYADKLERLSRYEGGRRSATLWLETNAYTPCISLVGRGR